MVVSAPDQVQKDGLAALRVVYEHSPDGVLFTSPDDGRILAANPAACRILAMTEQEICRCGRHGIVDADDPRSYIGVEELRRTGHAVGRVRARRGDGTMIEAEVTANVFEGDAGRWGCAIFRDVTDEVDRDRHIEQLSMLLQEIRTADELTGLRNRHGLVVAGTELLARADSLPSVMQVLLVDVAGVDALNRRLGHEAGDAALLAAARALRVAFRRSDVVARIGGTRFAVLALDLHEEDRTRVAHRIMRHLGDQDTVAFVGEPVDVALGWTTRHPGDPAALEELIGQSDLAMRLARAG